MVFAACAALLFGTSAIYHRGRWSARAHAVLKRLDHSNIFLIIAGSYTPFALCLLPNEQARMLLVLVWTGALAGVAFRVFWVEAPRWLTTPTYVLLGLVRSSAGSADLLGYAVPRDAGRVLHRVGSLVEGPAFHPYLSARRNLARLDAADRYADPRTRATRIDAALDRVGLLAAAGKRYRAYSLGMRQRLALAAALLVPRDLLVLDEPTNGLDPQGTREVRSLVGSLATDGTSVLVSSHLLAEVEHMCTHVGVLREGRLVAQGEVGSLVGPGGARLVVRTGSAERAMAVLGNHGVTGLTRRDDEVRGIPSHAPPEEIVAALDAGGDEEVFLLGHREIQGHTDIHVFSEASPLGAAVNGRSAGDRVSYVAPNGKTVEVHILKAEPFTG